MMMLSLKLLGEFAIRDQSGAALSLPTRKARALLGYLAANADKPQQRDRLMALLWGNFGEKQARHNLNQALLSIRKLAPDNGASFLDGDSERVTLTGDAIDSDLARFRVCLDSDPLAAANLYDGPFLDGLAVPDPAFEEWLSATRSEIHEQACGALERATEKSVVGSDMDAAIAAARRLLTLDPLREDGHRRLMQLLYDSGDRAGALRQYKSCADALMKALQVEPDAATRMLFEAIRRGASSATAKKPSPRPEDGRSADSPLSLPDKPSIVVLPFTNLSADREQAFFADGMTEDVITGLARFHSLFVIARNSSFSYKGQSPDVRQIARDLGVRYVLEGSVRHSGQRVRITAQLIDANTGNHLWAERYDRDMEDIFTVQDQVTEAIVAAIAPEIGDAERERSQRKPPESLEAWDIYQRGLAAYHSSDEEGLRSAIELFDRVNEIDPTFAPAFAMTANARARYALHLIPDNRSELLNQASEKARKAITLDSHDSTCLWTDGRVHCMLGHYDVAISKIEEAIALNPNDAMARYFLGWVLCYAGQAEKAIPHIDHAMRLSPRDIYLTGMMTYRAVALFDLERYEESFEWVQRARLGPNPRSMTFSVLTAVLVKLGRQEEARVALSDLLTHAPGMSCTKYQENPFGGRAFMTNFVDAMREAGLPE